jgi:nucleoside-diphosphate-sugar epimerase
MGDFSPSHIVNLAATTGTSDRGRKLEDYATNFHGLRNVMEIARGYNIEGFNATILTTNKAMIRVMPARPDLAAVYDAMRMPPT